MSDENPEIDPLIFIRAMSEIFSSTQAPLEPQASTLGFAHILMEQYTAYKRAGFNEEQAMQLTAAFQTTALMDAIHFARGKDEDK